MKYVETPEERDFRHAARTWLAANVPGEPRPHDGPAARQFDLEWQRTQYEGGFAGLGWPVEYGGRGLPPAMQMIWIEESVRAGAPETGSLLGGLNHAGPTLMAYGTDEQKQRHLASILRGEQVWCQGFSEPNAGSDLAGIQTKAVIDGDRLIVNGQKIWTSYADIADYQELLVRTSSEGKKHYGISWVICDMRTPGVEARPIEMMAGGGHFSEVFYTDVEIPLANVVGDLNDGWRVAMATLSFERGTAFVADQMRLANVVDDAIRLARETPSPSGRGMAIDDGAVRNVLGRLIVATETLGAMAHQIVSRNVGRAQPGADASMIRAYYSATAQELHRFVIALRGGDSLVGDVADATGAHRGRQWTYEYFWSYQTTIGGGTAQVQRNIIGERHLGLPR